jgi:hypothetical protein
LSLTWNHCCEVSQEILILEILVIPDGDFQLAIPQFDDLGESSKVDMNFLPILQKPLS